jgi:ketosteroid isomerase-like protein
MFSLRNAARPLRVAGCFGWLVACTLACTPRDPSPTLEEAARELIEMEAAFEQSLAAKDAGRFMSFWAEDAAYLPYLAPIADTPEGIRDEWLPLLESPEAELTWEPLRAEVAASGDLGYTWGEYRLSVPTAEGPRTIVGKYATIWRREPEGGWRVVLDTGSPNRPPD